MSTVSTRNLTPREAAFIADVLRRLRDHFREWPKYEGREQELIGFAFYEGCGGTEHCGEILAEAAPFALGEELVANHEFRWIMLASDGGWRYGVAHPALDRPINLYTLEDGSWNDEDYDERPCPGEMTHNSLGTIVERVRQLSRSA